MEIALQQVGKRFQRHWIFKNIDQTFSTNHSCALLGANGSGKSTLLRIIAGMQQPSAGKVNHSINSKAIDAGDLYQFVAFAAPGQEIVDEMTLTEFLAFHFSFKRMLPNFSNDKVIEEMGLEKAKDKQIGDFSSGMKQRVKLAQAIFADTPLLCLDEPCTNLDNAGVEQYRRWMEQYTKDRLVIVASNDPREYFFCGDTLQMGDHK